MDAFALLTAISFILFMSRGITAPVASLYAESLGAGYVAIGMLGTVSSLTAVAANAFWGNLSDRLGRRKVIMVVGLLCLVFSDAMITLAPDYRYLYVWNVLSALSQAAYGTASLALMGDLLEARAQARGRRVGAYRGLGSLGFGLMALNAGFIADRLSLRAPYGLATGLALLTAIIALFIREPGQPGQSSLLRGARQTLQDALAKVRHAPAAVARWLRSSRQVRRAAEEQTALLPLAPLLISAFLWSLVTGAVYAVWANYMVGEIGYSATTMSRLWALASLSEFPLMVLAGWLSDRTGRLAMLSLGFAAWCLVFGGYIVAPTMPWILGVQLVRGFAYSAVTVAAMAYATEVRGQAQRGRVAGLFGSAGGLGSIVGAATGGALTQWLGFRPMIGINAVLILGGAAYVGWAALRLWRKQRQGETAA